MNYWNGLRNVGILLTAVFGLLFTSGAWAGTKLGEDVMLTSLGLAVLGGCMWVFSHGAMKKP